MLAAATGLGLYYLVVLFLFYRKNIKNFFKSGTSRINLQADRPHPTQVSIMGPASPEAGSLLSDAAAIQVAPQLSSRPEGETADTVIGDILQELQPLLEVAAEAHAEKEEFLSLLRLVTDKYGVFTSPSQKDTVHRFLLDQSKDRLAFNLDLTDLQPLWPQVSSQH
ncbi:hypothetical protein CLV24_1424 [Pontibacter ummariensis]|uniref:Uncharacterized protein n=2 Tax=Pontibacter ummariensis TaxID=1610492 RepID=A0A239LGG3_9BACT|nr:hypothetical protein CLV24_1424 [Pontibacter ummariensis]SNT29716.1 hypothetical protein SAMN06296052_1424 [Pontibacter ummariensis]